MVRARGRLPATVGGIVVTFTAAFTAACAVDVATLAPHADVAAAAAVADSSLFGLRAALFRGTALDDSTARVTRRLANEQPQSRVACADVATLLELTFQGYAAGTLAGQAQAFTGPATTVATYVRRLSPSCASVAPSGGVPFAALDSGGTVRYVRAGSTATVETPDGGAGVRVPAGAFDRDVLLSITPLAPPDGAKRLTTTLATYGPYYDIATYPTPRTPFAVPVDVGVLARWTTQPPSDHLVLGHQLASGRTIAEQPTFAVTPAAAAGTACAPAYTTLGLAPAATLGLAAAGMIGTTGSVVAVAGGATTTHCGQASELSPFGLVQIYDPTVDPRAVFRAAATCHTSITATVASAGDLAVVYQPLDAAGRPTDRRRVVILPGTGSGAAPSASVITLGAGAGAATRVRFYYGPVPFVTVPLPANGCGG